MSRRDTSCRVSCVHRLGVQRRRGEPRLYRKVILLHPKNSRKINRTETIRAARGDSLAPTRCNSPPGDWADAKDGVPVWFPGFSCCDQRTAGRMARGRARLTDVCLMAESRRSSLAVQFGKKRFFLKHIAGAQQFHEWILRAGAGAADLS